MTFTSQPSRSSWSAIEEPTLPQPMTTAFIPPHSPPCPLDAPPRERLAASTPRNGDSPRQPRATVPGAVNPAQRLAASTARNGARRRQLGATPRRGSDALEHALRERDHEHLARRVAKDVVDRGREERRLAPPARRRAEHDEVDAACGRLLDDRLPDRAGANRRDPHFYAVVLAEQARLRERRRRLLLLLHELGVERQLERHLDDVERLDRRLTLLRE